MLDVSTLKNLLGPYTEILTVPGDACDGMAESLRQAVNSCDVSDRLSIGLNVSDGLEEQMERFQTENWRDVMSDAQSAADDVDSAKEELKLATDDVDDS